MFHGYGVAPMRVDDRSVVSCSKENSVWKIIPNFSLKEAKSRCLLQFPVHLVLHDLGTNNDPSQLLFYYEIRILESSVSHPVFGIGLAPPYFEEQGMVGWYKHSVGYHADDGYIFASTGPSYTQKAFSKYGQGDCVSVLWYNNEVYFAKNGQLCPHTSSRPFNKFMDFWATITTNMDVSSFQVITEMQHFQHLSRDVFPFLPEKLKRNKCMNRVTIIGGENVEQSPMIEIPTSTLEKSAIITTTQEGDSMASEDEMLLLRLQQDFTNLLSSIKTKNLTTHALQQQVRTLQMEKEQLQKEILTMKESFQQQQANNVKNMKHLKRF
ncbi:hypothetical protein C9374_002962 [Naegleria lovaniensis]|uniref:B30.2/SPRY domain-containing protein n=1 Tax=Naegleria lovaniensis TaxID=51637 RepID=A0AA88GTM9_NAELO|nr:uncharacterized protein C9374_002962 [Naegleria lovaniensis]KAG2385813.1 hypothetical protein C9374_002962 [Naegleria lovaniensis]